MRALTFRGLALAAAALAASFGPASAQSILASRGIGFPIEALDARSRGLGGITTGLGEPALSLINPAGAAGIVAPAISVTYQPDWYDATAGNEQTDGMTSRFPAFQIGFPVGRLAATLGYGAFLDQHWRVERVDSIDLVTGREEVTDRFISDGAIARFRVGLAYSVSERFGVGLAADLYTGGVRDTVVRRIGDLDPAVSATTFRYRGVGISAGARWSPNEALTVAASVSRSGALTGESNDSVDAEEKEYEAPFIVDAGASARIAPTLLVALSGRWAGWSAAEEDLSEAGGARDEVSVSGGLEYDGFTLLRQPLPVRLGGRFSRLPFRWDEAAVGNEFPDERAITGGVGIRLAGGAGLLDVAGERGWRGGDAAGVDESYWRAVVSVSLFAR